MQCQILHKRRAIASLRNQRNQKSHIYHSGGPTGLAMGSSSSIWCCLVQCIVIVGAFPILPQSPCCSSLRLVLQPMPLAGIKYKRCLTVRYCEKQTQVSAPPASSIKTFVVNNKQLTIDEIMDLMLEIGHDVICEADGRPVTWDEL